MQDKDNCNKEVRGLDDCSKAKLEHEKSRLEIVMGSVALNTLAKSTVMVFGLGGVGAAATLALARGGVGRLILVDFDTVSISNINRQLVAFHSTIGQKKTEVAASMIKDINPDIIVEVVDDFVSADNAGEIISSYAQEIDYVIDAIDTLSAKLAIAQFCLTEQIKLISSMGAANRVDPTALYITDLFKTQDCPMCRIMRKQARAFGIKELTVVATKEKPVTNNSSMENSSSRPTLGSTSYVPPIAGMMLAGHVIREITGV